MTFKHRRPDPISGNLSLPLAVEFSQANPFETPSFLLTLFGGSEEHIFKKDRPSSACNWPFGPDPVDPDRAATENVDQNLRHSLNSIGRVEARPES